MPRKQHAGEAGYIAERMNPYYPGTKVTIYLAAEQSFDVDGEKYAVVCDKHAAIIGCRSIPIARDLMKSVEFCQDCMDASRFTGLDKG